MAQNATPAEDDVFSDAPRARRRSRPLDVNTPQGTILLRRTVYGNETQTEESISVPVFHSDPARVRVGGGVTCNMGDYNSVRVDVQVELPALPEATEIQRAYLAASDMVEAFLRRETEIATGVGGDDHV